MGRREPHLFPTRLAIARRERVPREGSPSRVPAPSTGLMVLSFLTFLVDPSEFRVPDPIVQRTTVEERCSLDSIEVQPVLRGAFHRQYPSFAHPPPFKTKDPREMRRLGLPSQPSVSHSSSGGSEIFLSASKFLPHFGHSYSYVGTALLQVEAPPTLGDDVVYEPPGVMLQNALSRFAPVSDPKLETPVGRPHQEVALPTGTDLFPYLLGFLGAEGSLEGLFVIEEEHALNYAPARRFVLSELVVFRYLTVDVLELRLHHQDPGILGSRGSDHRSRRCCIP